MAALTWYVTNNLASVHQEMTETVPGAEATASPQTGWIVGTGATLHSPFVAQTNQALATFVDTNPPDGSINTSAGDCWRTTNTYSGSFVSASWNVHFACRGVTQAGTQDGRVRCRLFRGANADGSGATEITAAQQLCTLVTNLLSTTTQTSTGTFNPGAFSVSDEYIFVQLAWERTGAGGMTTTDVAMRIGVTTGSRVISADFTPQKFLAATFGGAGSFTQPVNPVSLLHFDGADGATTVTDEFGHVWTLSGNAQLDTAQSKFGGSSLVLDGSGDYAMEGDGSSDFAYGTGDFTIEMWVRWASTSSPSFQILYEGSPAATTGIYPVLYKSSDSTIRYSVNGTDQIIGTTTVLVNQWYHIAVARAGGSTRLFLDGTQEGSTYADSNNYINGANRPVIGIDKDLGTSGLNGWLDELRIQRTARWTSNFTPPTSNIIALLHFAGTDGATTFVDSSLYQHNFSFFPAGEIDNAQSKFGGTSALINGTTATILGPSINFENFAFGTAAFTVDFWVRHASVTGFQIYYDGRGTAATALAIYKNTDHTVRVSVNATDQITGTTVVAIDTWYHVAVTRSGTNTRLFINGTQEGSTWTTDSTNYTSASNRPLIGADGVPNPMNGWLEEVRVLKGEAAWTSNFTSPSAAYTDPAYDEGRVGAPIFLRMAARATFGGAGGMSVDVIRIPGTQTWQGEARFQGAGSLSALANLRMAASASFAGAGSLSAQVRRYTFARATFAGEGTLSVDATVITGGAAQTLEATFAGAGSLSGYASQVHVISRKLGAGAGAVSLLHFDGADASTAFTDEFGHTWTAVGDAQIDNAQSQFGGTSIVFDGAGDAINGDGSSDFAFDTGDFTVEFWLRLAAVGINQGVYNTGVSAADRPQLRLNTSNILVFATDAVRISLTTALSVSTWYHVALTRSAGSTRLFLNGVQEGGTYSDTNNYGITASRPRFGANDLGTNFLNGHIDELRILKGTAAWTANFTPPTQAYSTVDADGILFGGTGGLSVNITVVSPGGNVYSGEATFAGAGNMSANATLRMAAASTFAGAGNLSVSALRTMFAAASFNGAGGMSIRGNLVMPISALFNGAGSLACEMTIAGAVNVWSAEARFAGEGGMSVATRQNMAAAASFNGTGSMSATITARMVAQATFQGAGSLSAQGQRFLFAAATFQGTGNLSADELVRLAALATFQGTGSLSASANLVMAARATFAGAGSLSVSATRMAFVAAQFDGTGGMSVRGNLIMPVSAIFNGTGGMAVDAFVPGTTNVWSGEARFQGAGNLSAAVTLNMAGQATLQGAGGLSANANLRMRVAATFQGAGSMSANAVRWMVARATFAGAGNLSAQAVKYLFAEARFAGAGGLSAAARLRMAAAAQFTGDGGMMVHASQIHVLTAPANGVIFAGTGEMSVSMTGGVAPVHEGQAVFAGEGSLFCHAIVIRPEESSAAPRVWDDYGFLRPTYKGSRYRYGGR
jgi:hypothetical protein